MNEQVDDDKYRRGVTVSDDVPEDGALADVSLSEAFMVWLKVGLLSFGGPAAQIALMHKLVVAEKRWLSEKQYLSGLSFCMLLPGPEAMQLASYAGWRLHGTVGGLLAGLLFVIPGAIVVMALACLYALYGNIGWLSGVFLGIKAAVIIIVIEALLRVAKKSLGSIDHWVIAALSFIAIFFLDVPYPIIVIAAACYGFYKAGSVQQPSAAETQSFSHGYRSTIYTVLIWLLLWSLPFVILILTGGDDFLYRLGSFFSKLAVVTFGGAYAVLAYLGQDVVGNFGWLTAGEMMDGLGLAETTPGPLILVTEFVGFVAGFREGGIWLAVVAAMLTLWVTFVPCFLWIFAGAPYIEWISEQPRLKSALSAITAAVVGVILNLSVWFALHVWFQKVDLTQYGILKLWVPVLDTLDWRVVILTALCGIGLLVLHWSVVRVILLAAIAGYGMSLL